MIKYCLVCSDKTTCLACDSGNYLNQSLCHACGDNISHCVTCGYNGSVVSCFSCDQQSYMNGNACPLCLTAIAFC